MKKTGMKIAAAAIVLGAITFAGCSGENTQQVTETVQEAAAEAASTVSALSDEDIKGILSKAGAYVDGVKLEELVTPGDYKNLEVEVSKTVITLDDVDDYIEYVRSSMGATEVVMGRAVQEGDTVNIDYKGKIKETGEYFATGEAQGYDVVIGSGTFVQGFESGLIGAMPGEERDLEVTFPDNYSSTDLAGKEVIFETKVNEIKTKPTINDEYVKNLGIEGVNNLNEFREYLRNMMQEQQDASYEEAIEDAMVRQAIESSTFADIPEEMKERFKVQIKQQAQLETDAYNLNYGYSFTVDEYLSMVIQSSGYSGTVDEYMEERSSNVAKRFLLLSRIAQIENIDVTEDEAQKDAQELLESSSQDYGDLDSFLLSLGVTTRGYREEMINQKVVEFLRENVTVKEPAEE